MSENKTPWKKIVSDPNYIGEADFQEGEEKILTIKNVNQHETVVTAEGKSEKAVVHFVESGYKPMILNVARSKSIEKVTRSKFVEDWPGAKIQLYIESGIKAFGDIVSAVRVRPFKPKETAPSAPVLLCSDCGKSINPFGKTSAAQLAAYTVSKYGRALCSECAGKAAQVATTSEPDTEGEDESDTN